ncbi:unnamed protein product [Fraxinus pennsylvanica]|uniref:Increased DNA methylation 1 C-terminal domain-containing protein n=1 Tax=Fraxinus pennsylvanica TaxID=56036 RepID=A0AAD2DSI2_9LAMI|nr:unnamed protein product [Fraxinus pennsylvanica]
MTEWYKEIKVIGFGSSPLTSVFTPLHMFLNGCAPPDGRATCSLEKRGYFQILYSCIEKLLAFLNVRTFVLPAADDAKSIWTDKFGFQIISKEQLDNYRQTCSQMVSFKGTSMLAPPPDPGKVGAQAVALRISGDQISFHGVQDSLNDDRGRHYLKECFIQGS